MFEGQSALVWVCGLYGSGSFTFDGRWLLYLNMWTAILLYDQYWSNFLKSHTAWRKRRGQWAQFIARWILHKQHSTTSTGGIQVFLSDFLSCSSLSFLLRKFLAFVGDKNCYITRILFLCSVSTCHYWIGLKSDWYRKSSGW